MLVTCTSNNGIAPGWDSSRARQITSGTNNYRNLEWTPDGKLVFELESDIWIVEADGSGQKQLTTEGHNNRMPSACAGGYIVFSANRQGARRIWRMDFDGSNQKTRTRGGMEEFSTCSPDGEWGSYAISA